VRDDLRVPGSRRGIIGLERLRLRERRCAWQRERHSRKGNKSVNAYPLAKHDRAPRCGQIHTLAREGSWYATEIGP
jgi:hypothetical protein